MIEIIGFCLIGCAAGFLSGLLGVGGAMAIIPCLTMVFGFDQKMAQGTSLLLMVPPIGILAAREYYKKGNINIKAATVIASFYFIMSFFGGKIAVSMDSDLLRRLFSVFMFIMGIKIFIESFQKNGEEDV